MFHEEHSSMRMCVAQECPLPVAGVFHMCYFNGSCLSCNHGLQFYFKNTMEDKEPQGVLVLGCFGKSSISFTRIFDLLPWGVMWRCILSCC